MPIYLFKPCQTTYLALYNFSRAFDKKETKNQVKKNSSVKQFFDEPTPPVLTCSQMLQFVLKIK